MCLDSDQLDYSINWFFEKLKNNGNSFCMSLLSDVLKKPWEVVKFNYWTLYCTYYDNSMFKCLLYFPVSHLIYYLKCSCRVLGIHKWTRCEQIHRLEGSYIYVLISSYNVVSVVTKIHSTSQSKGDCDLLSRDGICGLMAISTHCTSLCRHC